MHHKNGSELVRAESSETGWAIYEQGVSRQGRLFVFFIFFFSLILQKVLVSIGSWMEKYEDFTYVEWMPRSILTMSAGSSSDIAPFLSPSCPTSSLTGRRGGTLLSPTTSSEVQSSSSDEVVEAIVLELLASARDSSHKKDNKNRQIQVPAV